MYSQDPARSFVIPDHFLNNAGSESWQNTSSGTGAAISGTGVLGVKANPGITTFNSGTTATGRVKLNSQALLLGGGDWFVQAIVQIPTLSLLAQEFVAYCGFYDGTTTDGSDTAMFSYDRLNFGDNWVTNTASGGVATTNSISAITAGTFYRLGIEVNAAATRVKFFINGALVKTHTTNIPTGGTNQTAIAFGGRKTAGTTSISMLAIDHVLVKHTLTIPRWTT